ncbi:unnamed protein product [Arabidopsis thaliana]|uniref:(thale cress) hypothetical protein n=1 Tax=Arabidopsis thaliana TaxID=3702 RepID=A0A7G2DRW3_ARATH|nr:unnamed protein product [Arabidopsis thaliana]
MQLTSTSAEESSALIMIGDARITIAMRIVAARSVDRRSDML